MNAPNAHHLPSEMAAKGLPAPTVAQVEAAERLRNPVNLAGAWMDSGILYVGTHDPQTDGTRCHFAIHPDGTTYSASEWRQEIGAPLTTCEIGPFFNHSVALMADYLTTIPGAVVAHTGGGCMAVEVEREEWTAHGFGLCMADEGQMPGDTCGAGFVDEGVAMGFGTVPVFDDARWLSPTGDDPGSRWEGVYEGCTIAPDPSQPGGWPTPERVGEILTHYGDAIAASVRRDGPPADFPAALAMAAAAGASTAAAFYEVSTY